MTPNAEEIFHDARELPPEEREKYLAGACAGNPTLRAEVAALLEADADAIDFLRTAAVDGPPDSDAGTPEADPSPDGGAGRVIDRYKLLQQIGEGGFGSVWMAEQREPVKRRVALKIIKLGMDTKQVIARFEAERQALALMDHPHIAKVLDAGSTENGRPYFVMEYIRGVPIEQYCDRERLNTRQRLDLFMQVCHAIQHAHQKGIIHRDIKPSNILVTLHDGVPVPKVIDFGIAKATSAELTQKTLFTEHHQIVGTPVYMSPEQAELSGLDPDTRTDVYALGVLLYELLTGTTPFDAKTLLEKGLAEMLRTLREVEPPRPSTRLSSLGAAAGETASQRRSDPRRLGVLIRGDLDWIVMKCLEKERTRRYESASELAADIRRHLDDEPVIAGPPSSGYRIRKFMRRHRAGVASGAVVLTLLIVAVVGTTYGFFEAHEQRELSESRAHDLELVSNFESGRLAAVDPHVMGAQIRQAILDSVPEDERPAARRALARTNFTTLALDSLEANILVPAQKAIGEQFREKPELQARLYHSLGETLGSLGLGDRALETLEKALALRRAELGDDHPDTVAIIYEMGQLATLLQGQVEAGITWSRRALDESVRLLGPRHLNTLRARGAYASALAANGKLAEAEAELRETLGTLREVAGEAHEDTLAVHASLGTMLFGQGRLEESEELLPALHELLVDTYGEEHDLTLTAKNNLSELRRAQGNFEEAERIARENLETLRRLKGDRHHLTLSVVGNLGTLLLRQGRVVEAEPYLKEVLDASGEIEDQENVLFLNALHNFSRMLEKQGRLEEAERFGRETVALSTRLLGMEDDRTLNALHGLGTTLWKLARFEESERCLRTSLEGRRVILGGHHEFTQISMSTLALCLRDMGRFEEAEALFKECIELGTDSLGPRHPSTLTSINNLGVLYRSQGRFEQALPCVRKAAEGFVESRGPRFPNSVICSKNHGSILNALGRYSDAASVLEETLTHAPWVFGPTHWIVADTRSVYGETLVGLERYSEAEPLLKESFVALEANAPPARRAEKMAEAAARLVKLYEAQGNEEQAEDWRQRRNEASKPRKS